MAVQDFLIVEVLGSIILDITFLKTETRRLARKAGVQTGEQKGRGSGGRNFCPPALPREARHGAGSGSSLRQQRSKARKNCFLN